MNPHGRIKATHLPTTLIYHYLKWFSTFGDKFIPGIQRVFVWLIALSPKCIHGLGDLCVHRSSVILAKVRYLRKNKIPIRHKYHINHLTIVILSILQVWQDYGYVYYPLWFEFKTYLTGVKGKHAII